MLDDLGEQVNNGDTVFTSLTTGDKPERNESVKPRSKRGRASFGGNSTDLNTHGFYSPFFHEKLLTIYKEISKTNDTIGTMSTKLDECLAVKTKSLQLKRV